jgi:outer membrane lipoprotein-sorting protein
MTVSRRSLVFASAALAGLSALPAAAQEALSADDRAALQQAQTYLQNLTAAEGTFVETGPGGQRREGRF